MTLIHFHFIHDLAHHRAASAEHRKHHHDERQQNEKPRGVGVSLVAQVSQHICPNHDKNEFQHNRHNRHVIQQSDNRTQRRNHEIHLSGSAHFVKFIQIHFIT